MKRIALGAGLVALLGLALALLPSPTPGGAATPSTGSLALGFSPSSTYFDVAGGTTCPDFTNSQTGVTIGKVTVSVTSKPATVTSVSVKFGSGGFQTVTLSAANNWEAEVPRSWQCRWVTASGLPWSTTGQGSISGTLSASTFD